MILWIGRGAWIQVVSGVIEKAGGGMGREGGKEMGETGVRSGFRGVWRSFLAFMGDFDLGGVGGEVEGRGEGVRGGVGVEIGIGEGMISMIGREIRGRMKGEIESRITEETINLLVERTHVLLLAEKTHVLLQEETIEDHTEKIAGHHLEKTVVPLQGNNYLLVGVLLQEREERTTQI